MAGSLLATLLGQRNIKTLVLEARRDPRQHGSQGGRSINLALSTRGDPEKGHSLLKSLALGRGWGVFAHGPNVVKRNSLMACMGGPMIGPP